MKPRIILIGAFPPAGSPIRGGIVTSCRMLMRSAFAERFDIIPLDSTQRSIPEPPAVVRGIHAARRVIRFVALTERHRPHAVVAFCSQGASFIEKSICAAYARARGIPTVLLMRGGPFMDDVRRSAAYRRVARWLLKSASVIPCQGEAWRRFFRDELGIDADRLPVIHNWTAREDYLADTRDPSLPDRPARVLFLSWVDAAKGIFELLEASAALWEQRDVPAFELHVAGGGAHLEALRARVDSLGLADRVIIHEWVSGDEKRGLYRGADVFVLASYGEGMPNSMIEAMSMGVPAILTPVGAIGDVIRDGENGLLVPPRDPHALRVALERLLRSRPLRDRIGQAGRETVKATFSLERGADSLTEAVHTAMRLLPPHRAGVRRPLR